MTGEGWPTTWPPRIGAAVCAVTLLARVAGADEVVLEPVRDNSMFEEGALSNGRGMGLFAGVTTTNNIRRALLAFDVADAIPAGSTVSSAQLTLRVTMSIAGNRSMTLHRVLADWGEGTSISAGMGGMGAPATPGDATWSFRLFDTAMWATPGGDFASQASATQVIGNLGPFTWSSTPALVADVQGWLDAPASNFGWIVRGDESDTSTAKRFASREAGSANRPMLAIEFEPPAGGATATATAVPTAASTPTRTAPPPATATVGPSSATPTVTLPGLPTATGTPSPVNDCTGDCSRDGSVTINELILAVNIALGARPVDECLGLDGSANGAIEINELIAAVNNAVGGCA